VTGAVERPAIVPFSHNAATRLRAGPHSVRVTNATRPPDS
jgi:hypothetical protein